MAHFYRWTLVPLACGVGLLALLRPPEVSVTGHRPSRLLDLALIGSLAALALQLLPLPGGLRGSLSPAALDYDRAMRFGAAGGGERPLSVDPSATLLALVFAGSIVLLFWCARTMFRQGGIRPAVRAVAWIGLFLSPLAVVHHVMPLPVVDLVWGATARGLRPFGPFVNRNDFAGWLIMATPLTLGYAVARMESRRRDGEPIDREVIVDSNSIWLGLAACLMLSGLLLSLSRSGLLGAVAGFLFFAWNARQRMTAGRARWSAAGLGLVLAGAVLYADLGALATRLEGSLSEGLTSRVSIWRQTWPMVRDFWPVGSGAGTFEPVMVRYQTLSRFFYISHADNEPLQILAEGGLLLGLPIAFAVVAGVALIARRLREDRTAIFWLRVGAAAGLLAVATQNMVEMTLRIPANAVLFAMLAAIAVHDPPKSHRH